MNILAKKYIEKPEASKGFRINQVQETNELISKMLGKSKKNAEKLFCPDLHSIKNYAIQMDYYRKLFSNMLGWPLSENRSFNIKIKNEIIEEIIYKDENKTISRLRIEIAEDITLYGLLFIPTSRNVTTPLVFALHGAKGCPELAGGLYGSSSNYNDMVVRALEKGFIVFVPQLNLWSEELGPYNQRGEMDQQLKMLGGSITALEIFKLKNALTTLMDKKYISKSAPKGIMGLSYGGMYALYTAAIDTRFDAVLSSCWLNEHPYEKGHSDWVHFNGANTFRDEQIAAMVCPRHLYIENGKFDARFPPERAKEHVEYIKEIYSKLNIGENVEYHITNEGHAFDTQDKGLNWLCRKLKV